MTLFKDYRERVPILQLAEHLGYKPVKGKYTKARPVLKDASGDTILIKNPTNPSIQMYWNLGNNREHGSVIDFVKHNLSRFDVQGRNETDSINKILSQFAGIAYDNTKYLDQSIDTQKTFVLEEFKPVIPEVKNLHYLTTQRKISEKTLNEFLPFIRIIDNNGYKNVAFPYVIADQDDRIRGFEIRNYGGFKSFSAGGDKVNATWVADFSPVKAGVQKVFFFESAIDALSFFEIKPVPFEKETSVFVSSGGFPCISQFKHVLDAYPLMASVYACHDNDLSGHLFDIQLACLRIGKTLIKKTLSDSVEFVTNDKSFSLKNERVNLKNFIKKSGIPDDVIALKPNNANDWNEVLQNKDVMSQVKKPVFN